MAGVLRVNISLAEIARLASPNLKGLSRKMWSCPPTGRRERRKGASRRWGLAARIAGGKTRRAGASSRKSISFHSTS